MNSLYSCSNKNKMIFAVCRCHFLLCFFIFLSLNSSASKIIGGSMTYTHLSGLNYEVKLTLLQDCSYNLPTDVSISVLDGLGNLTGLNFSINLSSSSILPSTSDSCSLSPTSCVTKGIYTKTINLASNANGYFLIFQSFSRDSSISNIYLSSANGDSYYTYIPDPGAISNSSPQWNTSAPNYICVGNSINFDYSTTDIDGDSLSYALVAPLNDSTNTINNPFFDAAAIPDNIHFNSIIWNPGYSSNSPFNVSGPPVTINQQTGFLSGTPTNLGRYLVGVKCSEYRSGVKINSTIRDFVFEVKQCPSSVAAVIGHLNGCNGLNVNMQNTSPAWSSNYVWNFGDGSPTVSSFAPSHAFPGNGEYTITLIAQNGSPCSDTATYNLKIGQITTDFNLTDSTCISDSIQFFANSTTTGNLIINGWSWDFGDSSNINTQQNPYHTFDSSGVRNVRLIVSSDGGCYGIAVKPVYVRPLPSIDIVSDTFACIGSPNINLNAQVNNAVTVVWQGNGGTFIPNPANQTVTYVPTATEVTNGNTELIVNSVGNGICGSAQENVHIQYVDTTLIDIGGNIVACNTSDSIPLTAFAQFTPQVKWHSSGSGLFSDSLSPTTFYFPTYADVISDSIQIIAYATANGSCFPNADTIWIRFDSPNTLSINYSPHTCENDSTFLDANSSTGQGLWTSTGDGYFTANNTDSTIYFYGANDFLNGATTFFFETTNNGGCPPQYDTLSIQINPIPHPNFSYNPVCYGQPTVLTSNVSSYDPISNYKWMYNGNYFSNNQNPSFMIPSDSTSEISLIVTTNAGCIDTITKAVKVNPLPYVSFKTAIACVSNGTNFINQSGIQNGHITSWHWEFGDNSISTSENPIHYYNLSGYYYIKLVVTADDGCKDSILKPITVHKGPDANYSFTPTKPTIKKDIVFTDFSTGDAPITSWFWTFGDGYSYSGKNTVYNYSTTGLYDVWLYVTDTNNCRDSILKVLTIKNRFIFPKVPTAFSPNGDGNNDILYPYGGVYKTLRFCVFDNWGQLIFESNSKNNGWNGKYKGKDQPNGTYIWTIKTTALDGSIHKSSGDINLIR